MNDDELNGSLKISTPAREKVEERNRMHGHLLIADLPNANGDVFPRALVETLVAEAQQRVRDRMLFGSMGEPMEALAGISHVVTELKMNGPVVEAIVEALDTPRGRILNGAITHTLVEGQAKDFPFKLVVSGFGKTKPRPDGTREITEFELRSVDVMLKD